MSNKVKMKLFVDVLMTGCLLFLMPYELVGRMPHEWIGTGMFLLFVLHHILNRKWTARLLSLLIAGYGAYAFFKRQIGSYMLLKIQFVFFDLDEPLVFFIADYMAVMGLFVFIGHYFCEGIRRAGRSGKRK